MHYVQEQASCAQNQIAFTRLSNKKVLATKKVQHEFKYTAKPKTKI